MTSAFPIPTAGFTLPRVTRAQIGNADVRDAVLATEAPRIPWDKFDAEFDWKQGEHVGLIGPTGAGKTSLLVHILGKRRYVAVTATKPRDATMEYLASRGYLVTEQWQKIPPNKAPKRVVWPNASRIDSEDTQRETFREMYREIYVEGGWAIVVDEGFIISEVLGLKREMRMVWTQGRSLGISQVVATQRPRWIPLEMYDQSTHLFFWQNQDNRSLDTLGDINGRNPQLVKTIIANLAKFQVLYVNTRTGRMFRTTPPPPAFDTGR